VLDVRINHFIIQVLYVFVNHSIIERQAIAHEVDLMDRTTRLRAAGGRLFAGKQTPGTKSLPGAMAKVVKNPVEATFAVPANEFVGRVFPGINPLSMQNHEKVTVGAVTDLMAKVSSLEAAMPTLETYGESMRRFAALESKKQGIIADTLSSTVRDAAAAQRSIQKVDTESAKQLSEAAIAQQKYEQSMALAGESARNKFNEANAGFGDRLRALKDSVVDRGVAQRVGEVNRQIGRGRAAIASYGTGKGDTQVALDWLHKMPQLQQDLRSAGVGESWKQRAERVGREKAARAGTGESGVVGMIKKAFT
jgi:hypothetical protein